MAEIKLTRLGIMKIALVIAIAASISTARASEEPDEIIIETAKENTRSWLPAPGLPDSNFRNLRVIHVIRQGYTGQLTSQAVCGEISFPATMTSPAKGWQRYMYFHYQKPLRSQYVYLYEPSLDKYNKELFDIAWKRTCVDGKWSEAQWQGYEK